MEIKIDHKSIKGKSKYNNTLLRKAKFYVMKCNKNTWNYKNKDKLSCNKQAWANETYWIRQTSIYTKMA